MGIEDEIRTYAGARVSPETAELELWDRVIFPNVIRKRQLGLVFFLR
jgi:hypothetical protein